MSSLELAFDEMDRSIKGLEAAMKAATAKLNAAKKAAKQGLISPMQGSLEGAATALMAAQEQAIDLLGKWNFDLEGHFSSGAYEEELLGALQAADVSASRNEDQIFVYPNMVKVSKPNQTVKLGKTVVKTLRPSFLAAQLKVAQSKKSDFKPAAFLEAIYGAYEYLKHEGDTVLLKEVYDLLVLMPGQKTAYSLVDFTRDLYLLDTSGSSVTKKGMRMLFPNSTGGRAVGQVLKVRARDGREKQYVRVRFVPAEAEENAPLSLEG